MRTTSTGRTAVDPSAPQEAGTTAARLLRVIGPVTLVALAAVIVWRSLSFGYWTTLGPGPGFFPLVLAVLLGVLAAVWLLEQVRHTDPASTVAEEPGPGELSPPEEPHAPLPITELTTIVVSLVVLTALLQVLGFQLSMLLFLVFQLKILGRRRWPLTIVLSVLGSFGIYTLFAQVLSVSLPVSGIPFLRSLGL